MILVDSNVVIDILTDDERWGGWSSEQLLALGAGDQLLINDVIYSEVSVRLPSVEAVEHALAELDLIWTATPRGALFLAGKAWDIYRKRGGVRTGVLPDLVIGAHAAVERYTVLTRDVSRYRTYFPTVRLITP